MKQRILLLSTVHPATDPRIRYKIAPSLAPQFDVFCALPEYNRQTGEQFTGISLPFHRTLTRRLLLSHPAALLKCWRIRPRILHIFVPELIPVALLFHLSGTKVIYEVQENLFKKFSIKSYNNGPLFQWLFRFFDRIARRYFHLILTEDAYLNEYKSLRYPCAVVRNFALPDLYQEKSLFAVEVNPVFLYVGVISVERCLDVMLEAFGRFRKLYPNFHVHLYGPLRIQQRTLESLPCYQIVRENLTFHGYTDQRTAFASANAALAGFALLRPLADYPESYTTKMFDYMSAGLPVITSDFPLYRNVVEKHGCGFCIAPENAALVFETMCRLASNKEEAARMGQRGRAAMLEHYSWETEARKLLHFYDSLL